MRNNSIFGSSVWRIVPINRKNLVIIEIEKKCFIKRKLTRSTEKEKKWLKISLNPNNWSDSIKVVVFSKTLAEKLLPRYL